MWGQGQVAGAGGAPQCHPGEATPVLSWPGHPDAIPLRLSQQDQSQCPGGEAIPGLSRCHRPSEASPGKTSPSGVLEMPVPVRPSWCHPSEASPSNAGCSAIPPRPVPVPSQQIHMTRPSQCHHPSKASQCCPGEVNPGAILVRPSQCQTGTASPSATMPVRLSGCHDPGEAILVPSQQGCSQCHHLSKAIPVRPVLVPPSW